MEQLYLYFVATAGSLMLLIEEKPLALFVCLVIVISTDLVMHHRTGFSIIIIDALNNNLNNGWCYPRVNY